MSNRREEYHSLDDEGISSDGNQTFTEESEILPRINQPQPRENVSRRIGSCLNFYLAPNLWWNIIYIVIFISLFACMFEIKVNSDAQIAKLRAEIYSVRSQMEAEQALSNDHIELVRKSLSKFQLDEQVFEDSTNEVLDKVTSNVSTIHSVVNVHEVALQRLSNGTSNADVLDKLKETQKTVDQKLLETHNQIHQELKISTRNVTEKLYQTSKELTETQRRVDAHLNETVYHMQYAVSTATSHIHDVEQNVTNQIDNMSQHVEQIVRDLSRTVQDAEDTIHVEVGTVQQNIEQYVAVTNKQFAAENDFVKYQLAGTFTLLGCLISLWHLTSHLRHYYKPDVQRRIMAVLWMVPIYGITSWLSLVFPQGEPFFAAIRDCYEAYAIYTFIALLIAILEDGKGLTEMVNKLAEQVVEEKNAVIEYDISVSAAAKYREAEAKRAARRLASNNHHRGGWLWNQSRSQTDCRTGNSEVQNLEQEMKCIEGDEEELLSTPPPPEQVGSRPAEHIKPPFPCCYQNHRPTSIAAAWLYQCQLMALQFVIMKPLLTIVPLVSRYSGLLDFSSVPLLNGDNRSNINWKAPNLYILFAQNVSVAIAFYGLLSFYHGTEKDLEWCEPWPKFLCIKGVVFATFWQNLTIQMFSTLGWVDDKAASQIQNLLICIEMLLASLAHFYIFPYDEWAEGYKRNKEKGIMLKDTLALRDFLKDMRRMVTSWDTNSATDNGEQAMMYANGTAGCSNSENKSITDFNSIHSNLNNEEGSSVVAADIEYGIDGGRKEHINHSKQCVGHHPIEEHYSHDDDDSMLEETKASRSVSHDRNCDMPLLSHSSYQQQQQQSYVFRPSHNSTNNISYGSSSSRLSNFRHTSSGAVSSISSNDAVRRMLLKKLQLLAPEEFTNITSTTTMTNASAANLITTATTASVVKKSRNSSSNSVLPSLVVSSSSAADDDPSTSLQLQELRRPAAIKCTDAVWMAEKEFLYSKTQIDDACVEFGQGSRNNSINNSDSGSYLKPTSLQSPPSNNAVNTVKSSSNSSISENSDGYYVASLRSSCSGRSNISNTNCSISSTSSMISVQQHQQHHRFSPDGSSNNDQQQWQLAPESMHSSTNTSPYSLLPLLSTSAYPLLTDNNSNTVVEEQSIEVNIDNGMSPSSMAMLSDTNESKVNIVHETSWKNSDAITGESVEAVNSSITDDNNDNNFESHSAATAVDGGDSNLATLSWTNNDVYCYNIDEENNTKQQQHVSDGDDSNLAAIQHTDGFAAVDDRSSLTVTHSNDYNYKLNTSDGATRSDENMLLRDTKQVNKHITDDSNRQQYVQADSNHYEEENESDDEEIYAI